MTYIKELAALTAAEMDDIYLRNVPASILEQYVTRLIAAYLAEQKPVGEVIGFFEDNKMPRVSWFDAYPNKGTKLFTAPPLPAIPDERIATLEQQRDELLAVAKKAAAHVKPTCCDLYDELEAAIAREAKLRDAAKAVLEVGMGSDFEALNAAFAIPADDSALMERLKQEREKCADAMWQAYLDGEESYSKLHDAIRSMT